MSVPPGKSLDKHYQAKILERRDLSEDLWLIRVDPGGPFKFVAGQYATLGVETPEKRIERALSRRPMKTRWSSSSNWSRKAS